MLQQKKTSAADVLMVEKEMTVSQNSVVGDAPEEKTSAADVPTPVKEMTFTQKSVAADAPIIPTSAADVPSPVKEMTSGDAAVQETSAGDVPNIPRSVADVPTDSTVPRSPSVATPHESAPKKLLLKVMYVQMQQIQQFYQQIAWPRHCRKSIKMHLALKESDSEYSF